MTKFGKAPSRGHRQAVITTGPARTFEGGQGFSRDAKSELFMLAAANFVGEDTFYEKANDRDLRFRYLVHHVTKEDPVWMRKMIRFLRNELNMRSAAVVAACEYAACATEHRSATIDSACVRPDEPAEMLGFWLSTYGRPVPIGIRRGIAKAAVRLYNERAALKYDGGTRGVRMGDVIEMCHPKPQGDWQAALFNYLITRRHGRETPNELMVRAGLDMLANNHTLRGMDKADFLTLTLAQPEALEAAGMTSESVSERVPEGMHATVWEALIPTMGYMALLRNLRNFEQAGVSLTTLMTVAGRLADPEQVRRSRQLPFRFYSAWKHSGSMTFAPALERAVTASLDNVPYLRGRSLILTDVSGSMMSPTAGSRSKLTRMETAALFASTIASRANEARLVAFGTRWKEVPILPSVLRTVDYISSTGVECGGGTDTGRAVAENFGVMQRPFGKFDRVIIVTDEQAHPGNWPQIDVPLYTYNLGGYRAAQHENGVNNKYAFGGLSDASFKLIPLLERRQRGGWDELFGESKLALPVPAPEKDDLF